MRRRSVIAAFGLISSLVWLLAFGIGIADAGGCKPDGQQCATNLSCCSRDCKKVTGKHGAALFGNCCTETTCAAQGKNCGTIPDGNCAGFTLSCGTCTAPQTCGGGGTPNVCGCTPKVTCATQGFTCGTFTDDCGEVVDCGTCTAPNTCGGGGTPGVCGCTPATSCPAGDTCGFASDGCGGTIDCGGTCTAPDTCGGGGIANQCGCTPNCANKECGSNGCGGVCGIGECDSDLCEECDANQKCSSVCRSGTMCNGMGSCDCIPQCAGKECGDNGCGGSCGDCTFSCRTCDTATGLCGASFCTGMEFCSDGVCAPPP